MLDRLRRRPAGVLKQLLDVQRLRAARGYVGTHVVACHPLRLRRLARPGDRCWPLLVGCVRRYRVTLRARALRRRRDVFLRRCGPGRLGIPLAQYLRPPVGVFTEPVAGRDLCRTEREPWRRNRRLWVAVLSRAARGTDRHFRGRPLTWPHHLRLRLWFDSPALSAGLWLSDRDVAGARSVLAGARRQPLCETNRRCDGTRFRHGAHTRVHA